MDTVAEDLRQGIPSLRNAWRYICDNIDYVPVFGLASQILDVLLDGPADVRTPVIAPLVKAVEDTRRVEGHDLSGRLFHTLLTDAKFTGAYYTSVPAATLLARLVFSDWPAGVDWSDHEFPASLNVADLACGTGTLLMAVAAEAERRHKAAGGKRAAALHKAMVEQALHGYDVQLSAVHFAATSLAMLNPHIEFDRMNLIVMSLGADSERISLGSLDFLDTDEALVQHALSPEEARSVSRGTTERRKVKLPQLDLAIMNPPFTRSVGGNLLFGSKPAAERRILQDELSRRLKSRQASATAGLGAAFVAAVSDKMLPGEGRLALVLPLTVCTGPSWAQTRALIEQDFALDVVNYVPRPPALELFRQHGPLGSAAHRHAPFRRFIPSFRRKPESRSSERLESRRRATDSSSGRPTFRETRRRPAPHYVRQSLAESKRSAGRAPGGAGSHSYNSGESGRYRHVALGSRRPARGRSGLNT